MMDGRRKQTSGMQIFDALRFIVRQSAVRSGCELLSALSLIATLGVGAARAGGVNAAAPVSLQPVVVTAGRLDEAVTNLPAAVQTVNRQQIAASGATSVDDALGGIAGADHVSYGLPGAGVKFDLRGQTADYQSKSVLVLQDGRRVNEAFQGNVEFAQMPPDNVDRMTVIKGPGSYAYGSGAMSGVLDIRSRSGRDLEPFGEVSAAAGNYETYVGHAAGGGQFGPFDAYAAAGHIQTGGYRPVAGGRIVDWKADDFFGNFGWTPGPQDEIRFLTGVYTGDGLDREGPRTVERYYQTASWNHAWDPDHAESLSLRGYNTSEHSTYDVLSAGLRRNYHLRTTGADLQETLQPAESLRLVFGGDARQDAAEIVDFASFDRIEWMAGLFAEGDLDLTDRLMLSLGLRYDKHESFDGRLSPRAALLYRVLADAELYTSVSQAYRTPGISDRYIHTKFGPFEIVGNPRLNPTIVTAYEAGMRQRIGRTVSWSAAVFRDNIRDAFDFVFQPPASLTSVNASRSYTQGVEAEGRVALHANVDLIAAASYTQGKVTEDIDPGIRGKQLANLAPFKAVAGLEFHTDRQSHRLTGRYEDARYADARNTRELDAHTVVDWTSRFSVTPRLQLTLSIWNLFDEAYRVYDLTEANGIRAAGRRFLIGAEAQF